MLQPVPRGSVNQDLYGSTKGSDEVRSVFSVGEATIMRWAGAARCGGRNELALTSATRVGVVASRYDLSPVIHLRCSSLSLVPISISLPNYLYTLSPLLTPVIKINNPTTLSNCSHYCGHTEHLTVQCKVR